MGKKRLPCLYDYFSVDGDGIFASWWRLELATLTSMRPDEIISLWLYVCPLA
jgi:hypothetical protein